MFGKVSHICLFFLLIFSGCQHSNERYDVGVIGHAASGLDVDRAPYPGNTQEAIDYARSLGAKHIEIDIQLSSDKQWVLFHNDFMDFHTAINGCINLFTANYLKTVAYHGYPNIKIKLLNDVNVSGFETVYLDVRHYFPCENFTHIDTAFLYNGIDAFVAENPEIQILLITNKLSLLPFYHSKGLEVCFEAVNFSQVLQIHELFPYANFVLRNKNTSAEEVSQIRSLGVAVILYDVKSYEGNIDAMRKNPNFVMTDAVASALILSQEP
jgi:glycerophosphoryl diester phosphodiesterase